MIRRPISRLYVSFGIVLTTALVVASLYIAVSARDAYREYTASRLAEDARMVEPQIRTLLSNADVQGVAELCQSLPATLQTRVTVILADGTVVGDSRETPSLMDNHGDRPEVRAALGGLTGRSIRFSHTLQERMMYAAVPVVEDGAILGVVRAAAPLNAVTRQLRGIYASIATGFLLAAILAGILGMAPQRRLSRDLRELQDGVEHFAAGDLDTKLPEPRTRDLEILTETLNTMADRLDKRIETALGQRNELETVLAGMVEGVVAVDTEEYIVSMNPAACAFFGVERQSVIGRTTQEVIRNADLQRVIGKALKSNEPVEGEIRLFNGGQRTLHVRGRTMDGHEGHHSGVLLVLHDVTQLQRLENVRRDFVANVSHELRTPITAIKGYVETLLDGALHNPEDAQRFVETINRHCRRLSDIIEDLLSLSRIEQGAKDEEIELKMTRLRPVLEGAIQTCLPNASAKAIEVFLTCEPSISARMNSHLMEQAIVNLLQNAIAYSEPEQKVYVNGSGNGAVRITVKDFGRGIEKHHIPRLFERFYRVDKARSRSEGGTGLGLAIVKHIVLLHSAEVEVESSPGKGSTFTIILPNSPDPAT